MIQVGEIRRVLKQDMRLLVKEVQEAKATLDGGDVLYTGQHTVTSVLGMRAFLFFSKKLSS
jgi:hypothetical protein